MNVFSKIIMLGVNHRYGCFVFIFVMTLVTGSGLMKLDVDTTFNSLISETNPDIQVYDRITHEFGSDNRTLIYVRDKNLWSPDKLAALEKLHYAFEKLDFVTRVDSLFNLRSIRGRNGQIDSRIILPEALKDQAAIQKAKADALYNPLIVGNFISSDGNITTLSVSVKEIIDEEDFDTRVNDAFQQIITPAQSDFEEVFQIGASRISSELKSILLDDLLFLGPLSACVLVFAILCFFRRWIVALIPLLTSISILHKHIIDSSNMTVR